MSNSATLETLRLQAKSLGYRLIPILPKDRQAAYQRDWRAADKLGITVEAYRARRAKQAKREGK